MDFEKLDFMGVNISRCERLPGEADDSGRLSRAVSDNPGGVILFPKGEYLLSRPLVIENHCSLMLAKDAVIKADARMDFLIDWNGGNENLFGDYGMFITGGRFDGAGISGGIRLRNIHHFTMRDVYIKDCLTGLSVGSASDFKTYELMASNIYLRNDIGIPGSVGIDIPSHGDHYLDDIIVVDFETGFRLNCYSTYLSKCHSWVTDVIPDISKTIAFDVGGSCVTLSDCYVDTSNVGVRVRGSCCRMSNVFGFHCDRYGGRGHTFISYETSAPFYLMGGTFKGLKDSGDVFFKGSFSPELHMQWVRCENLSGTEVLDFCKKNG